MYEKLDPYEQCLVKKLWKGTVFIILFMVIAWITILPDANIITVGDIVAFTSLSFLSTIMLSCIIPGPSLIYHWVRYRLCLAYGENYHSTKNCEITMLRPLFKRGTKITTMVINIRQPNPPCTLVIYDIQTSANDGTSYIYDTALICFDGQLVELYRDKDIISPHYHGYRHDYA